jgi:hypothetical protein
MRWKLRKILCIALFLAFAAYGQQQERIAVMHTVDDLDSIGVTDLGYLTDKLRDIASKILPKNRYGIMTQQSIVDRLGSQERAEMECRAATCLADLGRKISADYISQGRIGRFSGKLTIKVELYSVGNSNLLGAITGDSKDLDGLLAILEAKAPKLFEDMLEVSPAASEKPAPPPPVNNANNLGILEYAKDYAEASKKGDLEKAVDVELGYKVPEKIDPQVETGEYRSSNKSFWVALAFDLIGAGFVTYGIIKSSEATDMRDEYDSLNQRASRSDFGDAWGKVEDAESARNVSFVLGSVFLAAGIGVHIWF